MYLPSDAEAIEASYKQLAKLSTDNAIGLHQGESAVRFLIAILQVSKKDSGGEQHKGIGPKISMVMSGGPTQLGVQLLDWTMGYEEHLSL